MAAMELVKKAMDENNHLFIRCSKVQPVTPDTELSKIVTYEKFEIAYSKFLEQADRNAITQKSKGSKIPYGFTFEPKKNFICGGGSNYVYGGISLQECVVPIVEYQNIRASAKAFVETKKATIQLLSQSRKISNSIFSLDFYQPEQIGGKIAPATYEVYIADGVGQLISDRHKIIADRTGENGADRVQRARFTLKSMQFEKNESYFLMIVDKDTGNVLERIPFFIDIAFVGDFDF